MFQATPSPAAAVAPGAIHELKTTIRCTVAVDGRLKDCSVVSEQPAGHGAGAAAIKSAERYMQIKKVAMRDGHPVEGKIQIRFTFKEPDDAVGVPASSSPPSSR